MSSFDGTDSAGSEVLGGSTRENPVRRDLTGRSYPLAVDLGRARRGRAETVRPTDELALAG